MSTPDNLQPSKTDAASAIAVTAMVQRFFIESLLLRLVDQGALPRKVAIDIAEQTAQFARELAETPAHAAMANLQTISFEQIAANLQEKEN